MKNTSGQILLLIFLFLSVKISSQNIMWSKVLAGQQEDYGNAICLDPSSNVIITGSFQGICYGGSFALSSFGSTDIFVQKLSPTGTVLWTQQYGAGGADNGHSVATDSSGNIYVTGIFTGSVYFGATTLSSTSSNNNYFVLKLDPNGNVLWKKTIPGYSSHRPKIMVDGNNNPLLTAVFNSTRTFGSVSLNSLDGLGYVTKLSPSTGNIIWVTQFGSGLTLNGNSTVVNITTSNFSADSLGNIYVTGCFKGHGRFGAQNFLIPNSDPNSYIMKMSSSGTILWTKTYTGATEGTSIVLDANNNIYTAGNYFGQVNINNNTYTAPSGFYSVYLEKLDADGNLIWFKNYDFNTIKHTDVLPKLAIDSASNLFFSCRFDNTITFENNTFTNLITSQPYNILKPQILASFNTNGVNLWANQYEHLSDNIYFGIFADKATNIAVNDSGLYFTSGNSKFNDISYSNESGANIFVAKLSLPYVLNNNDFQNPNTKINLSPNPTLGRINIHFLEDYSTAEIVIYNCIGQLIEIKKFSNSTHASFDLNGAPGIFFVEVNLDGKKIIKKVIKV